MWHHVASENNPADMASRGVYMKDLLASNWFDGPRFLQGDISKITPEVFEIAPGDEEVRPVVHKVKSEEFRPCRSIIEHVEKFSSWESAITAFTVLRLCAIKRKQTQDQRLVVESREETARYLIQQLQLTEFGAEIECLQKNTGIRKTSSISQLDPFVDKDGVLRVGGRSRQSTDLHYEKDTQSFFLRRHT